MEVEILMSKRKMPQFKIRSIEKNFNEEKGERVPYLCYTFCNEYILGMETAQELAKQKNVTEVIFEGIKIK